MKVYDCVVRLKGDVSSEVDKYGVTPAEISILRVIHGADAVVRIQPRTNDRRSHGGERERLGRLYGDKIVERLFGPNAAGTKLPVTLPDEGDFDGDDEGGASTGASAGEGAGATA